MRTDGFSQLAFFLHLGKGQLIARRGRERTKDVPRDIGACFLFRLATRS